VDDDIRLMQFAKDLKPSGEKPDYQRFATIFNNGKSIFLEFDDHKYEVDIVEMRLGEYVVVKVRKPDQGLVNMPLGYDYCKLRVFTTQGKVFIFPTKPLQKKIPLMVFGFPEKEEPGFVRSTRRLFVRQSTPIILRKKDNLLVPRDTTAVGTITDLSDGGCSLISKMELMKGDKIRIFLNVSLEKERRNIELFCIVRRAGVAADGQGDYGLAWHEASEQVQTEIRNFLTNHPAHGAGR